MNAIQLLNLIKRGPYLQKAEIAQLVKLHESFPYFLIPKVLLAKYEFQKTEGKATEMLHWASVESPNRHWLKGLVESHEQWVKKPSKKAHTDMEIGAAEEDEEPSGNNIFKALIPTAPMESDPSERASLLKKLGEELHLKHKLEDVLSKKEETVPESATAQEEHVAKDLEKTEKKTRKRSGQDDLIETIRKKKKQEIVDEKKKKQLDIIKEFSKKDIKLATLKEIESNQKLDDLSEKSTQLHEGLLTESFARMLLKQGKKDKAKEIYKKLMVKFPEKNTYFADLIKQIEENS